MIYKTLVKVACEKIIIVSCILCALILVVVFFFPVVYDIGGFNIASCCFIYEYYSY